MYLIHSALRPPVASGDDEQNQQHKHLRYKAYKTVCEKYRHEIAAIQKYFPDWKPRFEQ